MEGRSSYPKSHNSVFSFCIGKIDAKISYFLIQLAYYYPGSQQSDDIGTLFSPFLLAGPRVACLCISASVSLCMNWEFNIWLNDIFYPQVAIPGWEFQPGSQLRQT